MSFQILYLAGFSIEIFKTSSESHAIRYIEEELTELPDAIVVAGGDGILSETITGLLRRAEINPALCPVGVLPVGMTNAFSLKLTNPKERPMNKVEKVKSMADASLAIVKGKVQKKDVMKIQLIDTVDGEEPKKPIYAVGSLHWGAFRDIVLKKERYWVTGPLRTYTAFLFNGFHRSDIQWNCKADLMYTDPCSGCSNCFVKQESRVKKMHNARWWAKYTPIDKDSAPDYSNVLNPNCNNNSQASFDSVEFILSTNTMENGDESKPKMTIKIDSTPDNYGIDFILNSWKRLWNQKYDEIPVKRTIEARSITLLPERPLQENPEEEEKESFYTIDNENYEVKPVKITLLPQRVEFFAL